MELQAGVWGMVLACFLICSNCEVTEKTEMELVTDLPAEEKSVASQEIPNGDNVKEDWEAPEYIRKMLPYYKSGYDYDGVPIYVNEYGKWDYREAALLSDVELEQFDRYINQLVETIEADGKSNNTQGIVLIVDWDGFTLNRYASRKAIQLALKYIGNIVSFNKVLKYGYIINTNFAAETFMNIARPFVGNILEKFEIYGGRKDKWRPALRRQIPADQLPPHYGGTESWQPLPFLCQSNINLNAK